MTRINEFEHNPKGLLVLQTALTGEICPSIKIVSWKKVHLRTLGVWLDVCESILYLNEIWKDGEHSHKLMANAIHSVPLPARKLFGTKTIHQYEQSEL